MVTDYHVCTRNYGLLLPLLDFSNLFRVILEIFALQIQFTCSSTRNLSE